MEFLLFLAFFKFLPLLLIFKSRDFKFFSRFLATVINSDFVIFLFFDWIFLRIFCKLGFCEVEFFRFFLSNTFSIKFNIRELEFVVAMETDLRLAILSRSVAYCFKRSVRSSESEVVLGEGLREGAGFLWRFRGSGGCGREIRRRWGWRGDCGGGGGVVKGE